MSRNETEALFEGITLISDGIIEEAESAMPKKHKSAWLKWTALAACLCAAVFGAYALKNSIAPPRPHEAPASETAGEGDKTYTIRTELTEIAVGALNLGMSRDEVEALLGQPDEVSNSGEIEIYDGIWMVSWWYRFDRADGGSAVRLSFIDVGGGWLLNEATAFSGYGWTIAGLDIGGTAETVEALFPNAQKEAGTVFVSNSDAAETEVQECVYSVPEMGLSVLTEDGVITSISVGPMIEDVWSEDGD